MELTDVVIVGGGPTGLMLAGELGLRQTRAILLERRADTVAQSRALSMHARSVEILGLRGLAERFIGLGLKAPTSHYAALDTRLDVTVLDTTYPFNLVIPQMVTERLLEARAVELDVDLRREWTVETVRDVDGAVEVSGVHPGGPFAIRARYVVGADGARSAVRQQSGIDFPGRETTMSIYFGDVFVEGPGLPESGGFQRRNPSGIIQGVPMPDGRRRLIVIDPARFGAPANEPVTLEELRDGVGRILGAEASIRDPGWMSRFGNETRLASRYRNGRVFLAGDAAHMHLPAGGQGMNTGLQDAMNLGWKLAGVVQGLAPETLLDSYDLERRPVGKRLVDNTLAQGSLIRNLLQDGDALWNAVADLLRVPAANRHVADTITALDTRYPDPLLDWDESGLLTGARLSDTVLQRASGKATTLFRLLHDGHWVDLRFGGAGPSPRPSGLAEAWVRDCPVAPVDRGLLAGLSSVLVRPDGHIAHATPLG